MADFSLLIQDWFRQNERNLPWRENKNPYFIWLSEIMLQQTRVDQATNYFLAFKEKYPTVSDLAKAPEDEVLNLWQGLGYYSRARNLHATAKIVHEDFNGEFPNQYKDILSLKGVGEYTAAAIGSIAFGLPYAVVDGNVYRVLSRYFNIDQPIDTTQGIKHFKSLAQELLDESKPGNYNQAIMEFGALQCTPKNPSCDTCPLVDSCEGYATNNHLNLPIKSKKTKVKNRYVNYVVLTDGQHTLLKKRGTKDIWAGLYDFPGNDEFNKDIGIEDLLEKYDPEKYYLDNELKHILSHQKLFVKFWVFEKKDIKNTEYEKVKLKDLENYPLPQLLVKYLTASDFFRNL